MFYTNNLPKMIIYTHFIQILSECKCSLERMSMKKKIGLGHTNLRGDKMNDDFLLSKTDKKARSKETSNGRTGLIGFVGGAIWSLLGFLFYELNFCDYGPALILAPFPSYNWRESVSKQFLGIFMICILSILVAFVYRFSLGRIKNMWASIGFGLFLWGIVFYVLPSWIPNVKPVMELDKNTITTTLCLYALYGLFVGYSISFDMMSSEKDSVDYSNG